jgi:hypothetical protein
MSKSEKVHFCALYPSLNLCQSARERPNFLKNWQLTNFDIGFQKINIRSRKKIVDFLNVRFIAEPPLKKKSSFLIGRKKFFFFISRNSTSNLIKRYLVRKLSFKKSPNPCHLALKKLTIVKLIKVVRLSSQRFNLIQKRLYARRIKNVQVTYLF